MTPIVIGERPAPWSLRSFIVFFLGLVAGAALCDGPPPTTSEDTYGNGCVELPGQHCECWPEQVRP